MKRRSILLLSAALLGTLLTVTDRPAQAHSFKAGALDIGHPWARATPAGAAIGGAYLKLDNHGADDKLLGANADSVANSVQLHLMSMDGNVMKMRQVDDIALPSGKVVDLKPGGYHLMLIGLKAALKAGDKFALRLKFENAGEVEVTVNVEAAGSEHVH